MFERNIHLTRHGEKGKTENGLTPKGESQMDSIGKQIELARGITIGSHSKGYIRTETSVRRATSSALQKAERQDKPEIIEDPGLGTDMTLMFSPDQLVAWKEVEAELGEDGNVHRILEFGKNQPDERTWSPYRIASGLAASLLVSINRHRESSKYGTEIKISHNGYIEALIMFLAQEQIDADPINIEGARFIDRIGGTIKMGDLGAKFVYQREAKTERLILELRGKQYEINIAKLEEMAKDYEEFNESSSM